MAPLGLSDNGPKFRISFAVVATRVSSDMFSVQRCHPRWLPQSAAHNNDVAAQHQSNLLMSDHQLAASFARHSQRQSQGTNDSTMCTMQQRKESLPAVKTSTRRCRSHVGGPPTTTRSDAEDRYARGPAYPDRVTTACESASHNR